MPIIDGRKLAEKRQRALCLRVKKITLLLGRAPCLSVLLVGDDSASAVYVRNKVRSGEKCGIRVVVEKPSLVDIDACLARLNQDHEVDGIIVQLPLPDPMLTHAILCSIAPDKDVDGLTPENSGLLSMGKPRFIPCTPLGCLSLLEETLSSLEGLHAVILGRSHLVGRPMETLLLNKNCTVSVLHSLSRDVASFCRLGDIVVVATGRPLLVKGSWIKKDAVVIDVGIHKNAQGNLVGDVDFSSVKNIARAVTPVPGGVGPMTVTCLLENTVLAAYHHLNK